MFVHEIVQCFIIIGMQLHLQKKKKKFSKHSGPEIKSI